MSTLLAGLATVLGSALLAILGLRIVERFFPFHKRQLHNDVAGFIYAVLGPMYAILLAFVVFVVWGHFERAKASAVTEANQLAGIYRLARALPEQSRSQIRALSIDYANDVIQDDWPLLATQHQLGAKSNADLDRLYSAVLAIPVADSRDQALYSQALSEVHMLADARRVRGLESEDSLSPILWITLVGCGLVTIVYAYLFGAENRRTHALMVATLAAVISTLLFVVKAIDGPFSGDISVTPMAFEEFKLLLPYM